MKTKDFYQIKPQNLISVLTLVVTALMLFATAPAFSQETIIYAEGFEYNNGNYIKIIEPADPQFSTFTGDGLWQWGTPSWISAHSGSMCWGTNAEKYSIKHIE